MSDRAAVLFANDAFYVAFLSNDFETMETLWARQAPVSCIHPGWHHLKGRDLVMESWRGILSNPEGTPFQPRNATANVHGDMAVVICYEVFQEASLVATNVFVREDGHWRVMHHQSGGSPPPPPGEEPETPETIQ